MLIFMEGSFEGGFTAVGPFYTQEDLDEWRNSSEADGFQMEVQSPMSNWENDFIQFPRLLSEVWANIEMYEDTKEDLLESMDITEDELEHLFERADRIWQDIKNQDLQPCEACEGNGWLETTEDKVERCDACKKYPNDDEAKKAFDLEKDAEYCVHCGKPLLGDTVEYPELPYSTMSAKKGESGILCLDCDSKLKETIT